MRGTRHSTFPLSMLWAISRPLKGNPRGLWGLLLIGLSVVAVGVAATIYLLSDTTESAVTRPSAGSESIAVPITEVTSPYLYVLDLDAGTIDWSDITADSAVGRVQVLDNDSYDLVKSIPTGYDPQIALSRDRQFVFLAETLLAEPGTGLSTIEQLRIFDVSADWEVVDTITLPSRWRTTGAALPEAIVSSDDGRYLYLPYHTAGSAPVVDYFVKTYDRHAAGFLEDLALPKQCGPTITAIPGTSSSLLAICRYEAHSIVFADPVSGNTSVLELPNKPPTTGSGIVAGGTERQIAGAIVTPDGSDLYLFTTGGTVYAVDISSQSVVHEAELPVGNKRLTSDDQFLSSTGSEIYVGLAGSHNISAGYVDRVGVYSFEDFTEVNTVDLPAPVRSFLVSDDGLHILGVDRGDGVLRVYESQTGSEAAAATEIGLNPDLIIK